MNANGFPQPSRAFTTSTAFSPTDTAPLSRRAKLLIQASLSLIILAVLAARTIHILKPAAWRPVIPPNDGGPPLRVFALVPI